MQRRTWLKASAVAIAASALGVGSWVQRRRAQTGRASELITGPWPALGPAQSWLLPDLDHAFMRVPDRPHRHEEAMDPELRSRITRTRDFQVSTSSARLRHPELGAPPKLRILAIGDSVTFGWGVTRDQSWPAQLQGILSAQGHQVEVINAGVPANPLRTIGAYLQHIAPSLSPDLVLLARRPSSPDLGAYRQAIQQARAGLAETPIMLLLPPISRFDAHGLQVYKDEAPRLQSALGMRPMELTEVLRAAQGQRGFGLRQSADRLEIVELASGAVVHADTPAAHDLPLSFYQVFEEQPQVREALMFDSGHPDAQGFSVLAQAIAQELAQRALI